MLNNWENGYVTDQEQLDALAQGVFALLDKLAQDACSASRPHDVHFFVEQQRQFGRIMRHITQRMPNPRR